MYAPVLSRSDRYYQKALPLIDLFLFDIKHTDKDLLQKETGANLDTILTNLRYISSKSANKVTIRGCGAFAAVGKGNYAGGV